jgi:hypothetical protein
MKIHQSTFLSIESYRPAIPFVLSAIVSALEGVEYRKKRPMKYEMIMKPNYRFISTKSGGEKV